MAARAGVRRLADLRRTTMVALVVALLATTVGVWLTGLVLGDQEDRLLRERADEVKLLLTTSVSVVPADLAAQGGILKATHGSTEAWSEAAERTRLTSARPETVSLGWIRRSGSDYVVIAGVGDRLRAGQVLGNPAVTAALDRARSSSDPNPTKSMAATKVFGTDRVLGFALGPPSAPPGTLLYRETALGPLRAPQAAADAAFSELDVALYATPSVQPGQVLVSTTRDVPLEGRVRAVPFRAGASDWLLMVHPRGPLVGRIAQFAPWAVLVVGLLGSILIAAVIESAFRRRDVALALYASEHRVAETLQRSLLPQLPAVEGLDLAARYLASGSGQMVGGDWFDVFPVHGGRYGIAVGDVIGHDVAAASAMAQIRAALRAYAVDGAEPVSVVTRLDRLVDTFGLAQLVTLVYAVLDPPDGDGSRRLRFTNAGHLAPLLRGPDGVVEPLTAGSSVVIGASASVAHDQAEARLDLGATLLLFTDGLVEAPGGSLDEALDRLSASFAATGELDADATCERVLDDMVPALRDDIALLALRVSAVPAVPELPAPATARESEAAPLATYGADD